MIQDDEMDFKDEQKKEKVDSEEAKEEEMDSENSAVKTDLKEQEKVDSEEAKEEEMDSEQDQKMDPKNSAVKTDLKEQDKVDSEKEKDKKMDSEQDQEMDPDSVAKTDLKEQDKVDSEEAKEEEMDSEQDQKMDPDSVAKTDLKEQDKVYSEKEKDKKMDFEKDQEKDYSDDGHVADSNIEQKVDSLRYSKHSKHRKMECKQSSKVERQSRSHKRPNTSTRCLRSSPSVANKCSKSSHSTATSTKAGKFPVTLDDIFSAQLCTHSRTRTPKRQPKPNKSAKEKNRKKSKPKTVTDKIDKKQHAEEKVVAEETDPEHNEKTEDAKDKEENYLEVPKKEEHAIPDSVSETNSDHDMKEEVEPEERRAKPDNLLELDPILKAFEKVHTVEEAVALLDISDDEKPKKSIALEKNIETKKGVMNVKVIGLKPPHKKNQKFSCPQEGCEEFKPTQGELNVHLQKVHHATFPCSKCDKKYDTANGLNKHFKKHFKFTNICSVCQKGFQFPKQLTIHEGSHRSDLAGKFKCPTRDCGKVLLSKQGLEAHQKIHDEQKLECKECGKMFTSDIRLKQHITGKHGEGCYTYCGEHYQWPDTKYRHQKICDKCKKIKAELDDKPELPKPIFQRRKPKVIDIVVKKFCYSCKYFLWY